MLCLRRVWLNEWLQLEAGIIASDATSEHGALSVENR